MPGSSTWRLAGNLARRNALYFLHASPPTDRKPAERVEYQQKCRRAFADWAGPVVSTEAVMTEATHLLAGPGADAACVDFFLSGGALLVPSSATSLQRVRKLLEKYAGLPMDFADATLVALAEELDCTSVFTTDRADFSVYRLKGRKPFRLLPND